MGEFSELRIWGARQAGHTDRRGWGVGDFQFFAGSVTTGANTSVCISVYP